MFFPTLFYDSQIQREFVHLLALGPVPVVQIILFVSRLDFLFLWVFGQERLVPC